MKRYLLLQIKTHTSIIIRPKTGKMNDQTTNYYEDLCTRYKFEYGVT